MEGRHALASVVAGVCAWFCAAAYARVHGRLFLSFFALPSPPCFVFFGFVIGVSLSFSSFSFPGSVLSSLFYSISFPGPAHTTSLAACFCGRVRPPLPCCLFSPYFLVSLACVLLSDAPCPLCCLCCSPFSSFSICVVVLQRSLRTLFRLAHAARLLPPLFLPPYQYAHA